MNISKYFQHRFTLSEDGAKTFMKGVIASLFLNLALMLPVIFIFLFITDYLHPVIQAGNSTSHGLWYYVLTALCFMTVLFVIAMIQYKSTYTKIYTESANRRIGIAEKLRKLPLAFFGEKNLSDLTATMMEDCNMLETLFSHTVPQLFASVISIILIATGMFFYNWQLALALFGVVPVATTVIFLGKRLMDKANKEYYHVRRDTTEQIQEGLEAAQEIKSYNGEAAYCDRLDKQLEIYEATLQRGEFLGAGLVGSAQSILKLGLASVIIAGAYLLGLGSIDMFTYLVFLLVVASIYNPIMDVFNHMATLILLDVRIDRIREMNDMPAQQGDEDCTVEGYDICFDKVDFAYETSKQVLRNVSFTAKQGKVTALVGPSGGGKSTSAKLAARFWDIHGGKITLGGRDISKIDPEMLLKNYAVVFQDVLLFNASVMDNIKIGKKDATEEEVKAVARLARCDEFIARLPNGYDTLIGENGESLSGGERQRISIARALLKDAPVILLDEATASLDVENETLIQAGISELIKNKTVVIIAHRMRTVANAHHIVVLKDGTVAEQGVPDELLARNGEFARMVARQKETGI